MRYSPEESRRQMAQLRSRGEYESLVEEAERRGWFLGRTGKGLVLERRGFRPRPCRDLAEARALVHGLPVRRPR